MPAGVGHGAGERPIMPTIKRSALVEHAAARMFAGHDIAAYPRASTVMARK